MYKGQTVTVYEELYLITDKGEFLLADHKELTDTKQQVKLPEIRTQAWDINTHDNLSLAGEGITITDTVSYTNLEPGHEYEIRGKLVNAADGDNHVIAESDVAKFVPDKPSGTADIPFALGSVSVQDNTTLVPDLLRITTPPLIVTFLFSILLDIAFKTMSWQTLA